MFLSGKILLDGSNSMEVKSIIADGVETFETEINGERIQWDSGLTYAKHIQTKQLLATQIPVSDKPDELLFIIMHQTMELWIKLFLHEVKIALKAIQDDELAKAFKSYNKGECATPNAPNSKWIQTSTWPEP